MTNLDPALALWTRFRADERGQDVVEYGLLAAIVGVAAILVWQVLVTTVATVYGAADAGVQAASSCTPDPIAAGGGCS